MPDVNHSSLLDDTEVLSNLHDYLRRYLRKRVDENSVEDLLQTIFVKALQAMQKKGQPNDMAKWLTTIARHTVIDHYRSRRPMTEFDEENIKQEDTDDSNALYQELSRCLLPMIKRLPPIYRDTLIAVDIHELKMRDVAAQEKVSLSAIKSRVSRGRRLLKTSLLACCTIETHQSLMSDYSIKDSSCCN